LLSDTADHKKELAFISEHGLYPLHQGRLPGRSSFMARKTKAEAEMTRQRIVDAAFRVFTEKGFTRTTLNNIADAANVTRGAIYWHFKDKVDLLIALSEVIDKASEGARPEGFLEAEVLSLDDLKEEVLRYLRHFEERDRFAVFYEMINHRTEYTEKLEQVRARAHNTRRQALEKMKEAFVELKGRGLVRSDLDPGNASLSLIALAVGLIEVWLCDRSSFCLAGVAPALLDEFLRSLKPEPMVPVDSILEHKENEEWQ
jgi:TetR/AcrR family acrAB operon transcriptional repressor